MPPSGLIPSQLDDIQGDIWSKGFPKDYETYYFFTIVPDKRREFAQSLKGLVEHEPKLISTLKSVSSVRTDIHNTRAAFHEARSAGTVDEGENDSRVKVANALIAFSFRGLDKLQGGRDDKDTLDLDKVERTDMAFACGMSEDAKAAGKTGRLSLLNDPDKNTWDPLFASVDSIDGVLKVAGSDKEQVETRLGDIKKVLKHGIAIKDVSGKSPPTMVASRVDGWTRPNHRGKEHFGYEDGISQPLMEGIDEPLDPNSDDPGRTNMNVYPHILIVTEDTRCDKLERPTWMYNGSFLVFRKLHQDVQAFEKFLSDNLQKSNCASKGQLGAKLMGRYLSGAPIAVPQYHEQDTANSTARNKENDFGYNFKEKPDFNPCPISAHIRKTNPRVPMDGQSFDPKGNFTRIIRNGIPYGSNFKGNETDPERGLLFACYQGNLEDAFINMQTHWSNNNKFSHGDPGYDPIVGQAPSNDDKPVTCITDRTHITRQELKVPKLVTMKGGEYFFVPSITALKGILAQV